MSFDLSKYVAGNFKVDNSPEGIREAAQSIVDNSKVFGSLGNDAPVKWAKSALNSLKYYDDVKAGKKPAKTNQGTDMAAKNLQDAFDWLTGAKQPSAAKSFKTRAASSIKETTQKLATLATNYTNVMDLPKDATDAEKNAATKRAQEIQADIDKTTAIAQPIGIDVSKATALVRTDSGYIPQADATMSQGKTSAAGEPVKSVQNPDGTYSVIGANSGKVLASGLADASAANEKMTELATGATPGKVATSGSGTLQILNLDDMAKYSPDQYQRLSDGAVVLNPGVTPIPGTTKDYGGTATIPAAGVAGGSGNGVGGTSDASGTGGSSGNGIDQLPPDQQEAAQHLIDAGSSDAQLLATMDLTPEGIQAAIERYLPTAQAESDPYYQQLYTRAAENYTYGMQKLASDRKLQLETEAANAQQNQDTASANAADAGLATSGIRKKLQDRITAQSENIAQSDLSSFNDTTRNFGRTAEELLGSSHLPTDVPSINGVPIFTPSGDVKGSIEANQTTTNQTEATALAKNNAISSLSTLSDAAQADVAAKFA